MSNHDCVDGPVRGEKYSGCDRHAMNVHFMFYCAVEMEAIYCRNGFDGLSARVVGLMITASSCIN